MCIIALKPEGVVLPERTLATMWAGNSDGAGFMYAENGQLKIVKGLMTYADFLAAYLEVGVKRKLVMHFRIRTSGAKNADMTHPFWVSNERGNELGMVHNGIISKVDTTPTKSDTAVFAEMLAREYTNPVGAVRNRFHREMIAAYIGSYNKLVFMDGTGETYIVNEAAGTRDRDGTWYSNGGFQSYSRSYTSTQWRNATGGEEEDETLELYLRRTRPTDPAMKLDDNGPGWLSRMTHGSKGETAAYASREALWDRAIQEREENKKKAKERAKARRQRRREEKKAGEHPDFQATVQAILDGSSGGDAE